MTEPGLAAALRAWDRTIGYSKMERMRAALRAAELDRIVTEVQAPGYVAPPVCGDMTGPNGVGGECVLLPGHPHLDGIGGAWPVSVPDRPALGTPRQPLTTTGEILAALAQVEADAEVNPDPHPLAEAVIIPDRSDTKTGDGPGNSGPVPAPPEGLIYRIAREVSGIQNWDQVRDFQAAHCAQVRKTIEVYHRLLVETGPAAEQPVQPGPDVIARFLETGTAEQNIHLHEQNVELRRLLAAAQGAASAGTGEPETFSQEIARKHEENLREQARSDYEAIQEAKRRAPAPDRVVSDPGREREGDDV